MITLYSTGCPNCNTLKNKLKNIGIDYTLKMVTNDEMIDKGFKSSPVLDIDGNVMDFSKAVQWIAKQ